MRRIGLILLLLLLPAPKVAAQAGNIDIRDLLGPVVSNDNLIVPGERIGSWQLQWKISDLVRWNGPASTLPAPDTYISGLTLHAWWNLTLIAFTRDGQKIEAMFIRDPAYKTGKRIGVGTSAEALPAAYGKPTFLIPDGRGGQRVIFDDIGIAFGVRQEIYEIFVMPKGSARSIWKF